MEGSWEKRKVTITIKVYQKYIFLDSNGYLIVEWLNHLLSMFFFSPLCVQPSLYYKLISSMKRLGEGINNKGSFI